MSNLIINPHISFPTVGGGGGSFLQSVVSSTCADLDATIASSYDGTSQTWNNLISAPADGAVQTAYDFSLGTTITPSTDDPTFTGIAGNAAAYFAMDGGDYFAHKDGVAALNAPTLRDIHKTTVSNTWWIAAALQTPGSGAVNGFLFGNEDKNNGNGIELLLKKSGAINLTRYAGAKNSNVLTPTIPLTPIDHLLILSVDMNASVNNIRIWLNSTIKSVTSSAFTADTLNTVNTFMVGSTIKNGIPNRPVESGTRFYSFAVGNSFLTDIDAQAIITHMNARHGRIYA